MEIYDQNQPSENLSMDEDLQVDALDSCLKSMCLLDMIILPEAESWLRVYTYCPAKNGYKYLINNGSGDTLEIWFIRDGVFVKGFDHESPLNQFGADEWNEAFFDYIYADVPAPFLNLLTKEDRENTTFCMWYRNTDHQWTQNKWADDDGGKDYLFMYICKTPLEWKEWADDYYERQFDLSTVQKIYNTHSVDAENIAILNPSRDINAALQEIERFRKTCRGEP